MHSTTAALSSTIATRSVRQMAEQPPKRQLMARSPQRAGLARTRDMATNRSTYETRRNQLQSQRSGAVVFANPETRDLDFATVAGVDNYEALRRQVQHAERPAWW